MRSTGTAAALTAAMTLALAACGGAPEPGPPAPPAGERLVLRETTVAALKPMAATVEARDVAEARARLAGALASLLVDEGDWVEEGQLIGVVVDERLPLQTAALDAAVAAADAEARRAEADLARLRTLYDRGFYARAGLDQAEAAADAARAQARAARAQRSASAATSAQGRILAPASGRVLHADVPAGSAVTAGQSVATITAGPKVLRLEAPEALGADLTVGQAIRLDPPLAGEGRIQRIYPAAVAGRLIAEIEAPGLEGRRIGEHLTVRAPVGRRATLLVPRRFVSTRFGIDYVRTVDARGAVSDAPVQLGAGGDDTQVEILSGVQAGQVAIGPAVAR